MKNVDQMCVDDEVSCYIGFWYRCLILRYLLGYSFDDIKLATIELIDFPKKYKVGTETKGGRFPQ